MNRRTFVKSLAAAGAAGFGIAKPARAEEKELPGSVVPAGAAGRTGAPQDVYIEGTARGERGPRTMLFWDYFRLSRINNAELVAGKPVWRKEATYVDPYTGGGGGGEVFFDEKKGLWRTFGIHTRNVQNGKTTPEGTMGIFISESEDGIRWCPGERPGVKPAGGEKIAPHHVATVPKGTWGSFYRDPLRVDGYEWKLALLQWGEPAVRRALADKNNPWHEAARTNPKSHPHIDLRTFIVSRDGLHWEQNFDYDWSRPGWHPEEPMFAFFNRATGEYWMTPRAGLGDRRQCLIKTKDFKTWTDPRLIMQPDRLDGKVMEFYAMPVSPYAQQYVGLVWACPWTSSMPPDYAVDYFGPTTGQLAWSPDGEYWIRPSREDFIPLNPAPEHGCGMIRPESVVELEDEIRIYSGASLIMHGGQHHTRITEEPQTARLMHSLRKDDFFHFESRGAWAEFTTKKFTLFDPEFTMNADARAGEVRFAITTAKHEPMNGFGYDDCVPLQLADSLKHPVAFKNHPDLRALTGKGIRLSVRFQGAKVYSFRGDYHFMDAHDWRLMEEAGLSFDSRRFGT